MERPNSFLFTVRLLSQPSLTGPFMSPFYISGPANVFLETIKRGDEDEKGSKRTVILRLYETLGGHAKTRLHIRNDVKVSKATLTNFLEDELANVQVTRFNDGLQELKLDFHGFEVKTVKLVIN